MKGNRAYAGMFLADPHPYPARGRVILVKPLTQRARRFEGHDWKIVRLFLHILNRPTNSLVPSATGRLARHDVWRSSPRASCAGPLWPLVGGSQPAAHGRPIVQVLRTESPFEVLLFSPYDEVMHERHRPDERR